MNTDMIKQRFLSGIEKVKLLSPDEVDLFLTKGPEDYVSDQDYDTLISLTLCYPDDSRFKSKIKEHLSSELPIDPEVLCALSAVLYRGRKIFDLLNELNVRCIKVGIIPYC